MSRKGRHNGQIPGREPTPEELRRLMAEASHRATMMQKTPGGITCHYTNTPSAQQGTVVTNKGQMFAFGGFTKLERGALDLMQTLLAETQFDVLDEEMIETYRPLLWNTAQIAVLAAGAVLANCQMAESPPKEEPQAEPEPAAPKSNIILSDDGPNPPAPETVA